MTEVIRLPEDHPLVLLAEEAWPLDFEGGITVIPGDFGAVLVHGANGLLLHAPNLERCEAAVRAICGEGRADIERAERERVLREIVAAIESECSAVHAIAAVSRAVARLRAGGDK